MAASTAQLNRRAPDDPEPPLQYKYRGIYETERFTAARLLFMVGRLAAVASCYSILVNPTSRFSIFQAFPGATPARPVPQTDPQVPFLPRGTVSSAADYLEMTPSAAILLFMFVGQSTMFIMYDMVWRRERMPLTGDGSAIVLSTATFIIDVLQAVFFAYLAGRNPTWSLDLMKWSFWPFTAGLALQLASDKIKSDFKESGPVKGEDKVLARGPWGIVRNPNYTGFHFWKACMSIAVFGWALGLLVAAMLVRPTIDASIPSIEQHLGRKYGRQFEAYKRKVPSRMLPGIY